MEKKKKLQLNKETISILNGDNMARVVGGANQAACQADADCPEGFQCITDICVDILHGVTSLVATPAGSICLTLNLSYNHCPSSKTDCETGMCQTRWCMS